MASLSTLVYLLYTARAKFDCLTAAVHYEYLPKVFRWVVEQWVEGRSVEKETLMNLVARDTPVEKRWGFWLKKPCMFRHDISTGNDPSSTLIINGEQSVLLHRDSAKPRTTTVESSTALKRAEDFTFIDPSPLLATHDLTGLSECRFLGRQALRFRALPRKRERVPAPIDQAFFCAGDHYDVIADLERGVLLQYEAVIGDVVYARARVGTIAFDEALDESVFVTPSQENNHDE